MASNDPPDSVAYEPERPAHSAGRSFVGALALVAVVALSLLVVLVAANRPGALIPSSNPNWFPRWLIGPLGAALPWLSAGGKTAEIIFTSGAFAIYIAYVLAVACAPSLRARWAIGAVVAVHVVFFLAPPLSLTDVFNYVNYGRMQILYHLNPYTTIPTYEPHADPAYLLSNWHELLSPYGPLFTILTFVLVPLGVAGAFWAVKGILAVMSLGVIFLVWKSARLLGRDPVRAIVFVGLNPLVLVYGLGGDHNDFITVFFSMLGVYLLLRARRSMSGPGRRPDGAQDGHDEPVGEAPPVRRRRAWSPVALAAARERVAATASARRFGRRTVVGAAGPGLVASGAVAPAAAGASLGGAPPRAAVAVPAPRLGRAEAGERVAVREHLIAWAWPLAPIEIAAGVSFVVAAGVKASAAVLIPVSVCALRSSPRRIAQLLLGMALSAAVVAIATYVAFGAHLPDISTQGRLVTPESVPNLLGLAFGLGGETSALQHVMQAALVLGVSGASAVAWRRRDLLAPAAWATLALIITLSWVLPWYVLWLLPLVALARSRVLVSATLVLGIYLLIVWVPLAGGWYRAIGFDPGATKLGQQHAYEVKQLLDY